jgi:hypothetical protein
LGSKRAIHNIGCSEHRQIWSVDVHNPAACGDFNDFSNNSISDIGNIKRLQGNDINLSSFVINESNPTSIDFAIIFVSIITSNIIVLSEEVARSYKLSLLIEKWYYSSPRT